MYVSFSGGKDSTVLKHIVDSMYSDVPALFVDTGLEFPEIRQFVKSVKNGDYPCFNSNINIVRPKIRFDEVIKTYGYPIISKEVAKKIHEGRSAIKNGNQNNYASRQFDGTYISKNGKTNTSSMKKWKYVYESDMPVSHMCCNVMKKNPAKIYEKENQRVPFVGNMASESRLRYNEWLAYGCNAFDASRPTSNPLSFWTDQDVLEYLIKYNVPYCSIYGDIVENDGKFKTTKYQRTGCLFCGFGCHLEKEPNRFQKLKETHPRQYDYCINGGEYINGIWTPNKYGLGMRKPLEFIGVNVD